MTIDGIIIFFKFIQHDGKRHSKKQKLHLEATEKYKVDFLPCQFFFFTRLQQKEWWEE